MVATNDNDGKIAKIRWRCRRGMLELDLILIPFFDKNFRDLSKSAQDGFLKLLDESDQNLKRWLLENAVPECSIFRDLCLMIKFLHQKQEEIIEI